MVVSAQADIAAHETDPQALRIFAALLFVERKDDFPLLGGHNPVDRIARVHKGLFAVGRRGSRILVEERRGDIVLRHGTVIVQTKGDNTRERRSDIRQFDSLLPHLLVQIAEQTQRCIG